jgi:transposase
MSLSPSELCLSCGSASGLVPLLPHLADLAVERVEQSYGLVHLWVSARSAEGTCARCGAVSSRVHSRYERRLDDAPAGGQRVMIRLAVRRFFCSSAWCPAQTFAEQIDGLTSAYARRTPLLRRMLEAIALALAGRSGARLAGGLGICVGRSTMLRLIRALPDPCPRVIQVLGVDEFALRRGHSYGTLLVDIATRRPVDVLPERSADSFCAWLDAHPGVEIICRDRAGCYADGAARGAPLAVQVADRWHLLHNLADAVDRTVARHRPCLREQPAQPENAAAGPAVPAREGKLGPRTRARHAEVHAALARGMSLSQISRELGLDRRTVRRYARAAAPGDMLATAPAVRPSGLDPHLAYLQQRWEEGCHSTNPLYEEIRGRGYRGSLRTLRRWTAGMRQATARPAQPSPPAPRKVTSWILTPPAKLAARDHDTLQQITARCEEINQTCALVRQFADMLCGRRGHNLPAWTARAEASPVRELRSFAAGLRKDWAAVTAGLTLPYGSGPVEGHVNRIKMIKRQMYGRANPDLLRKRILLADQPLHGK